MPLTAPERRKQLTFLIAALTALSPLTTDLYLPAFPAMGHDLHAGQSAIQLTLTAYLIGTAVGQLVAGPLSDAHGRIAPLRLALGLYVAITVVCAFSPNAGVLIGLRVAQGVIASTSIVVVRALVRDLFEGVEVARFLSRLMTITGLVPILAPFFGGQLLRVTDWRGVFVLLAVVGAVELAAMSRWLPETNPAHLRTTGGWPASRAAYRMLSKDKVFLGAALTSSFAFAALLVYISVASFVFERGYGLSAQTFGVIFGINAVFMVSASHVNVRIVGRVRPRPLILTSLLVMTAAAVVLVVVAATRTAGVVGLMIPLSVMLFAQALVGPNATAVALADHPEVAGTASAFLGCLQFVIGALLAPVAGLWSEGSATAMAALMGATTLVSLVVFLRVGGQAGGRPLAPSPEELVAV
ncbi:MAG: transporter, family, multidrug resistance protein [Frankiales bacterium]|nr:transporter, family, multidrug resistance protein [Frankiales bacterium]